MNRIGKGIAALILLGSLLTLAFDPPWIDLRQFGARPVQINTTGSGSGHSLTVRTNLFQQGANGIPGDGISVAGAGQMPQMHTPGAPTVTPGIAATLTVDAKETAIVCLSAALLFASLAVVALTSER